MNNKQSSLITNYLYNVAYKILTLITPLITTPYVSRVLGVENIGVYNFTYSIVSYFVLFGVLGLQLYGQREISYRFDDEEARSRVFWEITWVRILTVTVVLVIYLLYTSQTLYFNLYSIFGLEIIANALDISSYYYGTEEFKIITIRNFIVKLVGVICIFLFVKSSNDLPIYILSHVAVLLIGNISLWFGLKSRVKRVYPPSKHCLVHLRIAFVFFLPQCIDSIYMLMDKVMLGSISTMQQVGLYGQADKIVKIIVTIITSIGIVVSPRIAQCFASNNNKDLKKYMNRSIQFVFEIGFPMVFGLSAIAGNFSIWFFGAGYEGVERIMIMLTPIILFMGLNSVMGWQYLMTVRKEKSFIISVSIGAFTNLILNMILIPKYQAMGAVIASIVSMALMTIKNTISVRDVIDIDIIISNLWKPFLSSVAMFIAVRLLSNCLPSTFSATLILTVFGGCIFIGLEWVVKDTFVLDLYKKV